MNKENSDIETRNNSLNYFNFDKNITKAILNIKLNTNSKIYIANSKLKKLVLRIIDQKNENENSNLNNICLTFLDTLIENVELISTVDMCKNNINYVRSKITNINLN